MAVLNALDSLSKKEDSSLLVDITSFILAAPASASAVLCMLMIFLFLQ